MKTIFDKTTRDELIARINTPHENCSAQSGKMNIYEKLEDATLYEAMLLSTKKFKRMYLGHFFGKMALKELIDNDNPIKRNLSTFPEIKITISIADIAGKKRKWIEQLEEHENSSAAHVVHRFSGVLIGEKIAYL